MEEKTDDFLIPHSSLNNYFHNSKMKIPEGKIKKFRLKLSLNSKLLIQKKTNLPNSTKQLIKEILINNIKKHNSTPNIKNTMLINDLIESKENHFVAVFKDYLISDYIEEFLKRYYSFEEALVRLPKFYNYYKNYLLFFCKPTFRENFLNDIIQNYGECKAELYYNDNYGHKNTEKSKNENKKNSEILKSIFTESIRNNIAKIQDNTFYMASNETKENINKVNEQSIILTNSSQNNSKSIITQESSIIKIVNAIKEKNDNRENILNEINEKNNDSKLKQQSQTLCETYDSIKNNTMKENKKLNVINETLNKINNMKNTKNSFKISQKQIGILNEKKFLSNYTNTINSYRNNHNLQNDINRIGINNKKIDKDSLQLNLNNINYNEEKSVRNYLYPLTTVRMDNPEVFSSIKIINKSKHLINSELSQKKSNMNEHIKTVIRSIKANSIDSHKKRNTIRYLKSPPNTTINNFNININNHIVLSNSSKKSKYSKNKSDYSNTNLKKKKISRNFQNKLNNFNTEGLLYLSNNKHIGKNSEINLYNMKKIENEHRQRSKDVFIKNRGFPKNAKIINAFQNKNFSQKNFAISSRRINGNEINKLYEDLQGASSYKTLKLINNNRNVKDKKMISSYKFK